MSGQLPSGRFLYERLDSGAFQKLIAALLAHKYDHVTSYPVGQKDGGRDVSRRVEDGAIVYQVKWTKNPIKNPVAWLDAAIRSETENIKRLVGAGAKQYVLITNVEGTSAVATGTSSRGQGTIDGLTKLLDGYEQAFGVPMDCWWRTDLDTLLASAPIDVLWTAIDMLAGDDLVRYVLQGDRSEVEKQRMLSLLLKVIGVQWQRDEKVKFKQAELDNDDLETLFVDVKVDITADATNLHRVARPFRDSMGTVGAAAHLLSSSAPFTLVRGEPGQGKSTLGQYVAQVHRAAFVADGPAAPARLPALKTDTPHLPLRLDLRDYGAWLEGMDPFTDKDAKPSKQPKPRKQGQLTRFLAVLLGHLAGGVTIDTQLVSDILDRFRMLLVLDGLDEVALPATRRRVVDEIDTFTGLWRGKSVVPKIIVTTRPNAAGLPEPSTATFETITLVRLDEKLRSQYLRNWCHAKRIQGTDRRDLMKVFNARTAEPHIAQLSENPMQLTILLYLMHKRGVSVPDTRTPLYTSYMETFLDRESAKWESVRENRTDLEEITSYLGWYLQGLAERNGSTGRLKTADLKTQIYGYLTRTGKKTHIVDDLFTDVTDRVWALASKWQGEFEFDVQPVREYFAARYLNRFSSASKSDMLREMVRRPFWFNTSRFFAGFASENEIANLAEALEEEREGGQHPLQERTTTWTLLSDGVFAARPRTQLRAVALLTDDLSVRLLGADSAIAGLDADRGGRQLYESLLASIESDPSGSTAQERFRLAARLNAPESDRARWWLDRARVAIGGADEHAWLRLAETWQGGAFLTADDQVRLALNTPGDLVAGVAAGITPARETDLESRLLGAVLSGLCSDVLTGQVGLVHDMANVLAPREFLGLTGDSSASVFKVATGHYPSLLPGLRRQQAFGRLKKVDARFARIQLAMATVRRSTNTVAPWSDAANSLREIYGPSWLAADIAIIGAAISPKDRRDTGVTNPNRTHFGANVDYGNLVDGVRHQRANEAWWASWFEAGEDADHAVWAYALVAAASPAVVRTNLDRLCAAIETLDESDRLALFASSSRLGASGVSRRLPADLVSAAVGSSCAAALLVSHHADDLTSKSTLTAVLPPEALLELGRFGVAAWPALRAASELLFNSADTDLLAVLRAHGPAAPVTLPLRAEPMAADVTTPILGDPARYPLTWVQAAEQWVSRRSEHAPLAVAAGSWFDE